MTTSPRCAAASSSSISLNVTVHLTRRTLLPRESRHHPPLCTARSSRSPPRTRPQRSPPPSMADRPQRRRALRRSKLIVRVHELGRVEGSVVSVIEGVVVDIERRRVLLQPLQLLD